MIRGIQIEGLKALRKTKMISVGRVSLLTGINGRGKSSFLQALLLLSQSLRHSNGSPAVLFPDGDWCSLGPFKDLVNVYSDNKEILFRYETDSLYESIIEMVYRPHEKNPYFGELKSLKVDGLETISNQSVPESPESNNVESGTLGVTRVSFYDLSEIQRFQKVFFVSASRFAAANEGRLNMLQDPKFIGAQGQNVLTALSQCSSQQLKDLEDAMSTILDGAYISTKTDLESNSVSLFLDSDNDGHKFKPVNVGYGYSYIISLLLSLVLASKGEYIIIENPEAHLHPQAQARLMEYLVRIVQDKDLQCFIESHSDHIVNGLLVALKEKRISLEDAKILFFERNDVDNKPNIDVSSLELTSSGRVRRPPKGFCDQYGIDLRKLI